MSNAGHFVGSVTPSNVRCWAFVRNVTPIECAIEMEVGDSLQGEGSSGTYVSLPGLHKQDRVSHDVLADWATQQFGRIRRTP